MFPSPSTIHDEYTTNHADIVSHQLHQKYGLRDTIYIQRTNSFSPFSKLISFFWK